MAGAMVEIQMPEMGESVTEGTILEWHKHEGDFVEQGETVVEVSTDKVDAEIPAPASGTITKLVGAVDDVVSVGAVLAELEAGAPPSDNGGPSTTAKAAETALPACEKLVIPKLDSPGMGIIHRTSFLEPGTRIFHSAPSSKKLDNVPGNRSVWKVSGTVVDRDERYRAVFKRFSCTMEWFRGAWKARRVLIE